MLDYIQRDIIPCCAYSVQQGEQVLLENTLGWQDRETNTALRDDAVFRIYSSSKLMSSVLAMHFVEQGTLALDQPVSDFIPAYADLQVLRAGASDINDTEALQQAITIRHLLSHTAGFTYGFVDPEGLVDQAYLRKGLNMLKPYPGSLSEFINHLAQFPLAYQPGSDWRYSVATDVLGHVLETLSGDTLDNLFQRVLFDPLQMHETGFVLNEEQASRLVTLYEAPDLLRPMTPGYRSLPYAMPDPCEQAPFLSAGGGLYSTMADMQRFMACLANGGGPVLKKETLTLMLQNQLPMDKDLQFPLWDMPDTGFGLGFALKYQNGELQHYYWGGLAGTHSWVRMDGLCGLVFTQLMPAFWHPFGQEFQRMVWEEF
jgi:CubicO group peptidase (beta-lactamase class C family)